MKLVSNQKWNALHDLIYDQQNIIEALRDYTTRFAATPATLPQYVRDASPGDPEGRSEA
jgi:hypothetical protein